MTASRGLRNSKKIPAEIRFWGKVTPGLDYTQCWPWLAAKSSKGYGMFCLRTGVMVMAHRFAYESTIAPIPEGLTIDHLCRVRLCVNPYHLEPVPNRVNIARGKSPIATHIRTMDAAA